MCSHVHAARVLEELASIVALDWGIGTSLGIESVTYLHSLRPLRKTIIFEDHAW